MRPLIFGMVLLLLAACVPIPEEPLPEVSAEEPEPALPEVQDEVVVAQEHGEMQETVPQAVEQSAPQMMPSSSAPSPPRPSTSSQSSQQYFTTDVISIAEGETKRVVVKQS